MAKSKGLKRLLASILSIVGAVVGQIPGLNFIAVLIQVLAGGLGTIGLGHAVLAKTVKKRKLTSLAALFAAILAVSVNIPFLAPYVPIIEALVALLAAFGIGNEVVQATKK